MSYSIDPEDVLRLCKKLGGYDGVVKHLAAEKVVNPKTKKPYGKSGVQYLATQAKGFKEWRAQKERSLEKSRERFAKVARKTLEKK